MWTNNYLHSEILGLFPQEVDSYLGNAFAITTLTHSIQHCCQLPSNSRNLVMVMVKAKKKMFAWTTMVELAWLTVRRKFWTSALAGEASSTNSKVAFCRQRSGFWLVQQLWEGVAVGQGHVSYSWQFFLFPCNCHLNFSKTPTHLHKSRLPSQLSGTQPAE